MSLRSYLRRALASKTYGDQVADAILTMDGTPMATIIPLGVTTNLPTATTAGGSAPTAANVDTSVNALKTAAEARLDAIEAKIDAILAGLTASGKML